MAGRQYTPGLWATTEPAAKPATWWRKIADAWRGTESFSIPEAKAGVREFKGGPKRLAALYHDGALAAGFESELRQFTSPDLGRWWVVNVRQPGDSEPEFLED